MLGDFVDGATVRKFFHTSELTGEGSALSSGAIRVYKDGGTTELSAGITLTADFDGRTGLNLVEIDTTQTGYDAGSDYAIILTVGTVGGVSVAPKWIDEFSIENRNVKANVTQIEGADPTDTIRDAVRLVAFALTTGTVTTDGGNSATSFETDLSQTADNYWTDAFLLLTSGVMAGQVKRVTAYNGTTKIITVSGGFTGTPADGVTFTIINR